ncbi:MAG: hypothetical protein IJZ68_06130 [Bacteroidaceae bacterium]|nr:hypothetical protein [Bacteroidaceae bacterium]
MKTLEMLANLYIANLQRHRDFLRDKVVVFDFDGTMTAFRYGAYGKRLLPCKDDEIYEYSKTHNIYAGAYVPESADELEKFTPDGEHAARMLGIMQWLISELPQEHVFVLTRTEMTLIDKKNEAILKNFNVLPQNIYHVQDSRRKVDVLDMIHERFGKDVYFVEDTFKTQLDAEEAHPWIHGVNISEFHV